MNNYIKAINEASMNFDKEKLNAIASDIAGMIKNTEAHLVAEEKRKDIASLLITEKLRQDNLTHYNDNIEIFKERLDNYNNLISVINEIQKIL